MLSSYKCSSVFQVVDSGGSWPCHILVDRSLGFVFIANYGRGSFCAHSIDKETGEFTNEYVYNEYYGPGQHDFEGFYT